MTAIAASTQAMVAMTAIIAEGKQALALNSNIPFVLPTLIEPRNTPSKKRQKEIKNPLYFLPISAFSG